MLSKRRIKQIVNESVNMVLNEENNWESYYNQGYCQMLMNASYEQIVKAAQNITYKTGNRDLPLWVERIWK